MQPRRKDLSTLVSYGTLLLSQERQWAPGSIHVMKLTIYIPERKCKAIAHFALPAV